MKNKLDNRGVTLVEVMISLVILLIVFMGLIQASLLSIDHNLRNEVRDEGVRIASEYMTVTKSTFWGSVADTAGTPVPFPGTPTVVRSFRNWSSFPYRVQRLVRDLGVEDKEIRITVLWNYRDDSDISHTIFSTMRNK